MKEEQNKIEEIIYKFAFKSKKGKKTKRAFVGQIGEKAPQQLETGDEAVRA